MTRAASRGASLVESMIGLALGLVVTAGSAALWGLQLRDGRDQLAEARLNQDLRAALDLVGRDLRRSGYWAAAASAAPSASNPYAAFASTRGATDTASYAYSLDAVENGVVDSAETLGFRVQGGALQQQLGAGNWQPVTDATTFTVTGFGLEPDVRSVDLGAYCAVPCAAGAADCPPRLTTRALTLTLEARTLAAPVLTRRVQSQVRLRNDRLDGRCGS